jgi:hypothetical protein
MGCASQKFLRSDQLEYPACSDGLQGQLEHLFDRMTASPLPVHLVDLVNQLEQAAGAQPRFAQAKA